LGSYPFHNTIDLELSMLKFSLAAVFALVALSLTGCYQMHSDDDLRTIPVTNNPNIIPGGGARLPSAPM